MTQQNKPQRNYGIDALRMLSMYFVVVLHVLLKGSLLSKPVLSVQYETAWFLETLAFCAVDCFALISGYVGIHAKYRYTNLVLTWLKVFFYSVIITLIFAVCMPETVGIEQILDAIFPVFRQNYWYVCAYVCLFFFIPVINKGIHAMTRAQNRFFILALIVLFSVCQTFLDEIFRTNVGYSGLWLIILYMIGAYISKYNALSGIGKLPALFGYLSMCIAAWCLRYVRDDLFHYRLTEGTQPYIYAEGLKPIAYISPFILFSAIFLLLLFRQLKIGEWGKRIIKLFAPMAFSVYIIHAHPLIWDNILPGKFNHYAQYPLPLMVLAVLVTALAIYLACSIIDYIREVLFRVLRIKKLLLKLENRFVGDLWE